LIKRENLREELTGRQISKCCIKFKVGNSYPQICPALGRKGTAKEMAIKKKVQSNLRVLRTRKNKIGEVNLILRVHRGDTKKSKRERFRGRRDVKGGRLI